VGLHSLSSSAVDIHTFGKKFLKRSKKNPGRVPKPRRLSAQVSSKAAGFIPRVSSKEGIRLLTGEKKGQKWRVIRADYLISLAAIRRKPRLTAIKPAAFQE
jgi:hypothetical protein